MNETIDREREKTILRFVSDMETLCRRIRTVFGNPTEDVLEQNLCTFFERYPVKILTRSTLNQLYEIKTVRDLIQMRRSELLKYRNLGIRCLDYIEDCLAKNGLSLSK